VRTIKKHSKRRSNLQPARMLSFGREPAVSGDYPTKISKQRIRVASVDENSIGFGSMVFVVASIYAVTVLFCVGITAWIVRAWTRRRYWHKSPSDLHYIAAGAALLVGAGIGILIASQIVMALAISLI
jgi:hypothetical protein